MNHISSTTGMNQRQRGQAGRGHGGMGAWAHEPHFINNLTPLGLDTGSGNMGTLGHRDKEGGGYMGTFGGMGAESASKTAGH